jgi:hypothetical protein
VTSHQPLWLKCFMPQVSGLHASEGDGGEMCDRRQATELGVETIEESEVPGNSTERLEAREVMSELGADLDFVMSARRRQR